MPTAEIITIGTELLLGEIIDTNTQFIARLLNDNGIDVYRSQTVGDNVERISAAICEAYERCDIIITTGGLGPTIDDPTREAIANAFNQNLVFEQLLWEQIQERFASFKRKPTENNRRQAFIPQHAIPIRNPVGTAPAFYIHQHDKYVFALPGVPKEMEHLMTQHVIPILREEYILKSRIFTRILHTAGVGESQIDEKLGDLEQLSNPTVGLAAHTGQVDIRISAKAETDNAAFELIDPVEEEIRKRLKDWIFGVDSDTLEQIALQTFQEQNWVLIGIEIGFSGELLKKLSAAGPIFTAGEMLKQLQAPADPIDYAKKYMEKHDAMAGLIAEIYHGDKKLELTVHLITPLDVHQSRYSFGGPPSLARVWAVNYCLNFLRKTEFSKEERVKS